MIDHVTIRVSDYETSRDFYTKALRPLGYEIAVEYDEGGDKICGWKRDDKWNWWIRAKRPISGPVHVAFTAADRKQVDAFYAAALAAGAADNGAPGERPHYHPGYYSAFVIDPDGNNIEAVCHLPE
ncbi:MAG TPA: VOC family protein [Paucimonas sp.]|nr:VOC family protein [Paucimonas sp.]